MELVNSTITGRLNARLDLGALPNAVRYRQFPGVKVTFPNYSVMFFRSGKFNVLGYRSPDVTAVLKQQIQQYLSNAGVKAAVSLAVKNKVYKTSLGDSVNLSILATTLRRRGFDVFYEAELYPGLRVWDGWCALVYHTGAAIITGVKTKELAESVYLTLAAACCT